MKRLAILLFVVLTSAALVACSNSEFSVDGEFTAFELSVKSNAPVVTSVTVTIEGGEVTGYHLDVRQGTRTSTVDDQGTLEESDDTVSYSFAWNSQTKRELGYEYKLHYSTYTASLTNIEEASIEGYQTWLSENNKLEWFEQAELIEDYWLEEGVDKATTNEDGDFTTIASVSISNQSYNELAEEALQLAREGKFQAIYAHGSDLYIATMTVDSKGKFSDLILDVQQADKDTTLGTFEWKLETKQELGYLYHMHYYSYTASLSDTEEASEEGYIAWLTNNDKLEWSEQVNLITDYIETEGWVHEIKNGLEEDDLTGIDALASVSVSTEPFYYVLSSLFDKVA